MIYFVLILYLQTPPAPYRVVEIEVDRYADCQAQADIIRAINKPERGRFVTWYECQVRGVPK